MTCEEYRIVQEIDQKLTAVIQYVNQLQTNYQQKCQEVAELQSQLAEANRRADAAVRDILCKDHCDVCKHSRVGVEDCETYDFDCEICKSTKCACRDCRDEHKWEWRGAEKGTEDEQAYKTRKEK